MLDNRKSGLIQHNRPSLSRNELIVNQGGAGEIKPGVRVGGASKIDKFSNSNDLAEVNSETVITVPRMVQQPIGGAFSVGDHVVLVADAVGDNQDGGEIALNGGFDTDTLSTKGTGWTITAGLATSDASQLGDSDLTNIGPVTIPGVTYQVTFTISGYIAGNVTPVIGDTEGTDRAANGTFTELIIAGAGTDIDLRADVLFDGNVNNISVVATPLKQWQKDASDMPGENDATLVLANIQLADDATYSCDFFNAAGKTSSANAVVAVT